MLANGSGIHDCVVPGWFTPRIPGVGIASTILGSARSVCGALCNRLNFPSRREVADVITLPLKERRDDGQSLLHLQLNQLL